MKILFSFLFVTSSLTLFAQDDLNSIVSKLQSTFSKVETASKTFEQEIKLLEYSSIRYAFDEIDLKGTKILTLQNLISLTLILIRLDRKHRKTSFS
ncbi:MAG: hypothetical protein QM734_10755 [Cyclobacteriaceae bacterium]